MRVDNQGLSETQPYGTMSSLAKWMTDLTVEHLTAKVSSCTVCLEGEKRSGRLVIHCRERNRDVGAWSHPKIKVNGMSTDTTTTVAYRLQFHLG